MLHMQKLFIFNINIYIKQFRKNVVQNCYLFIIEFI